MSQEATQKDMALGACAHLRVEYRTEAVSRREPGLVTGWWQCRDCATRFAPVTWRYPQPPLEVRRSVHWFAEQMEQRLRANDHKGGWEHESPHWLLMRLQQEILELAWEVEHGVLHGHLVLEAADVGNLAMMVAEASRDSLTPLKSKGPLHGNADMD